MKTKHTKEELLNTANEVKKRDGFYTYSSIGSELGLSRQRIEQLFKRHGISKDKDNQFSKLHFILDNLETADLYLDEVRNIISYTQSNRSLKTMLKRHGKNYKIKPRKPSGIVEKLRSIDTQNYTIRELREMTNYQGKNLASLLDVASLPYKRTNKKKKAIS